MMVKKIKQRPDTFKEWRKDHLKKRERYVLTALNSLSKSKFSSITALAEGVAKIVTQFELSDAGLTQPNDKVKGMKSSTLLSSKSKYKPLLEAEWSRREGFPCGGETEAISELEELRAKCATLAHDNDLFRDRLAHKGLSCEPIEANQELELRKKQIKELVSLINGIYAQLSELLTTVLEGEENDEHPKAGLYGPSGFIIGVEVLELLRELSNE